MRVVTYEETLRALNEAVREKGYKYTYGRRGPSMFCYNTWHGQPDCIVGHVMVRLGVPIEWFDVDNRDNDDVGDVCKALYLQDLFEFEDEAKDLLGYAQSAQDNNVAWGEAVTRAHLGDDVFESLGLNDDVFA